MRYGGEKKRNNLVRSAAAGSAAAVLALSLLAGAGLRCGGPAREATESGNGVEAGLRTDAVEFGAVRNPENQAAGSAPGGRASGRGAEDERMVFKIIEVIPHDACSVFPYLVDWGSPEEYDRNVTIGYEGLMTLTTGWDVHMFTEEDTKAKDSYPFTIARESVQQSRLKDYDVPMSQASNPQGKWYRKTQDDSDGMLTQDGYFEYVGEEKGLYYLSSSYVTDDPDGKGIRYETRAVERLGTENPKGEMYVADAAYYVAKEHQSSARPDYTVGSGVSVPVVSQTGYHYSLSFSADTGGSYEADVSNIKISGKKEYEYHLVLKGTQAQISGWASGFTYAAGGNYKVTAAAEAPDGKYVRISDGGRPDGYTDATLNLDSGYFRLASAQDAGAKRYSLTFGQAADGCYYANRPAIWSGLKTAEYSFAYAGEGKGFYDVAFRYSVNSLAQHYREKLVRVKQDQGRYALTATTKTAEGSPVYREKDGSGNPADYTKIIRNISFQDMVNTSKKDAAYNPGNTFDAGVGINLGGYDAALPSECGGFIFVPVTDKEKMKETPLSSMPKNTGGKDSNTDSYYKVGDRIYVTGQERRYRYYCRDGFYNNEWFKLLCYSNHPKDSSKPYTEMIDGVGYDYGKTPGENLADPYTKELLRNFEQNVRLEIVQIPPERLTAADVRSAQMIYISNQEGIQKLAGKWNDISEARVEIGLPPLDSWDWGNQTTCPEFGDLSDEALMAIYDECIWTRNRALIASIHVIDSGNGTARTNLQKLGYFMNFFREARNWAEFMPDQYPDIYNEEFSRVKNNAEVKVCKTEYFISEYNSRKHYNWGYDSSQAEEHSTWINDYFKVFSKRDGDSIEPGYEFEYSLNWNIGQVLEGETKLTVDYWLAGFLQNINNTGKIWQLIQNSREDRSRLEIEVLNARQTAGTTPQLVIYGDEYEEATFELLYRVKLIGGGMVKPELNVYCEWEDGSLLEENLNASYSTEYRTQTRKGFTVSGSAGGVLHPSETKKTVVIRAENANGKTAETEVTVIVRESFDLN